MRPSWAWPTAGGRTTRRIEAGDRDGAVSVFGGTVYDLTADVDQTAGKIVKGRRQQVRISRAETRVEGSEPPARERTGGSLSSTGTGPASRVDVQQT